MDDHKRLHVLTYQAEPLPESEYFGEIGGAFVNVWVDADSSTAANGLAREEIENASWRILSETEISFAVRGNYSPEDEELEYFDEAVRDGMSLVFHSWPIDEEPDD